MPFHVAALNGCLSAVMMASVCCKNNVLFGPLQKKLDDLCSSGIRQSWVPSYRTGCFASLSLSFAISKMRVTIEPSYEDAVQRGQYSLWYSKVSSLSPPCLHLLASE